MSELRPARVAAGAFLISGLVMGATGVMLTLREGRPAPSGIPTTLFWAWVAAAIGGVAGWYALWQRARRADAAQGVRRLVASWGLLEAQLVVALVASILGGTPMLLVPAFTILALGLLLSYPAKH